MISFIVGMVIGAGLALMILGFLAVAAEDEERQERARKTQDPWRWYRDG